MYFRFKSFHISSTFTTLLEPQGYNVHVCKLSLYKNLIYAYIDICQSVYIALHEKGGQTLQTLALYNTNTGIHRWE